MTLITHFWSSKINLIAGERRVLNATTFEPIADQQKVFNGNSYFIAFHGHCDFKNINVPNELEDFIARQGDDSMFAIANNLKAHFEHLDPSLPTGFMIGGIGGNSNKNHAFYLHIGNDVFQEEDVTPGKRMNYDSQVQGVALDDILLEVANRRLNGVITNLGQLVDLDEVMLKGFIQEYFEEVENDPIANPPRGQNNNRGIGGPVDIGIVKDSTFKWISNP